MTYSIVSTLHPDIRKQHEDVVPVRWVQDLREGDDILVSGIDGDEGISAIGRVVMIMTAFELVCVKWFNIHSYNMTDVGCFLLNGLPARQTPQHLKLIKDDSKLGQEVDGQRDPKGIVE